jgi:cytosolic carboxypeptidase protein 5
VERTEENSKVASAGNDDEEGGDKPSASGNPQQFLLSFQHLFGYSSSETTFFAFCYPFSFEESTELTDRIEEKLTRPENRTSIYFHREVLYYSLEGRKMEVVTISSRDHITDEQEDQPEDSSGLYPES